MYRDEALQLKHFSTTFSQPSPKLILAENYWSFFLHRPILICLSLCCEELLASLESFNKLLPHPIGVKFRHFATPPATRINGTHLTPRCFPPSGTCCAGWLSTVRDRAPIRHVRHFNWPHQLQSPTAARIRNLYGILHPTPSLRQNFIVNIILAGVRIVTGRWAGIVGKKNELCCAWMKRKYWFFPSVLSLFLRLKISLGLDRNGVLIRMKGRKKEQKQRFSTCGSCVAEYICWNTTPTFTGFTAVYIYIYIYIYILQPPRRYHTIRA
jgi:hypothetical protein